MQVSLDEWAQEVDQAPNTTNFVSHLRQCRCTQVVACLPPLLRDGLAANFVRGAVYAHEDQSCNFDDHVSLKRMSEAVRDIIVPVYGEVPFAEQCDLAV